MTSENQTNQLEKELVKTYYPDNVLQSKRILGFKRRNIIEGAIFALCICAIIYFIPFVTRVKIIFMVILGASFFAIGLIGICGMSVTEFISTYINFKKHGKEYHYRIIENKKQNEDSSFAENSTAVNESIADKLYREGKKYAKETIKRLKQ